MAGMQRSSLFLQCTKSGCFDPSIPQTRPPPPSAPGLATYRYTCAHINTHMLHTLWLPLHADLAPAWFDWQALWCAGCVWTSLIWSPIRPKSLLFCLSPLCMEGVGRNVCQIKNTFAAALNSTSKTRKNEGDRERGSILIRRLNEG